MRSEIVVTQAGYKRLRATLRSPEDTQSIRAPSPLTTFPCAYTGGMPVL
jgi:hypothetical protein